MRSEIRCEIELLFVKYQKQTKDMAATFSLVTIQAAEILVEGTKGKTIDEFPCGMMCAEP